MDLSILLATIALILFIYWYFSRPVDEFSKQGIPGPTAWPVFGTMLYMIRYGMLGYAEYLKKNYGKLVRENRFWGTSLAVFDVDLLKDIMIKESNSFTDRDSPFELPKPFDRSIASLTGDDWRRVRHGISPAFTSGKLKKMCSLVYRSVNVLSSRFKESSINKQDIDLKELYGRFTLSVIAETMFGMQIDSLRDENDIFVKMVKKMTSFNATKMILLMLQRVPGLHLLLSGVEVIDSDVTRFFMQAIERAIEERKGKEDQYHDFLSLMLKSEISEDSANSAVRGLTNHEIMGQSVLFMFAGYETSSIALTYVSYLLAIHPEVQERLREEISSEFRDDTPEALYESVSRMSYLDQCIKEGMRLYSPAVMTDRKCTEDVVIGNIKIRKGNIITVPIQCINRDPELWKDPLTFNPERFADENGESAKLPFHYLVFGNGPRNCVGLRFALMTIKLALIDVLRNVRLVECDNTPREPMEFEFLGISKPKKKIIIKAETIDE